MSRPGRAVSRSWLRPLLLVAATVLLAACATGPTDAPQTARDETLQTGEKPDAQAVRADAAPASIAAPDAAAIAAAPQPAPALLPLEKVSVGAPTIRFKSLEREVEPRDDDDGSEVGRGTASWYGLQFHGRQTANGERYNMYELTAAHKTLPFGTIVRVRNLQSGHSVDVRINDRGPYVDGRVIDLSKAAAEELGMAEQGLKPVSISVTEWPDALDRPASKARTGSVKAKAAARTRSKAGNKAVAPPRPEQ